MIKKALITGITGQDGSYLAELLLEKGYEVYGLIRRHSTSGNLWRIEHILSDINLVYGDITDQSSLYEALKQSDPDEVYHLAAMSFVGESWRQPSFTYEVNAVGTLKLLESIRQYNPSIRVYNASSSVTGDTPILIRKNGEIQVTPIATLMPPDITDDNCKIPLKGVEVLSADEHGKVDFTPVSHIIRHLKDQIYIVRYKGGGILRVTGDHSVIVFDKNGNFIEKAVANLQVGDYLITYNGADFPTRNSGYIPIPIEVHKKYQSQIRGYRTRIAVSGDLMRLLGYYLAEGHCDLDPRRRNYRVSLTFHLKEEKKTQDIKSIVTRLFPELAISEQLRPESTSRTVTISGKVIASLCAQFGCNAKEKHLPSWIWELDRDLILEFLRGYLGDAQIRETEITFTTASPRLAQELVYLMRNIGMGCRIYRRRNTAHPSPQGKMIPEAVYYDIKVSTRYARLLSGKGKWDRRWVQTSLECLPSVIFQKEMEGICFHKIKYKPLVSREKVWQITKEAGIQLPKHLENLLQSGLGVAKVREITTMKGQFHVYDVVVPNGQRFFGGNIPVLLHNSEMFGKVQEVPQTEKTPFYPLSPYAVSKVAAFYTCLSYRMSYDMFICSGISFNHGSPRRGLEFVTRKITHGVAQIMKGKQKYIELGNIKSKRDWGHAKDYVRAFWLMLQQKEPDDYVIATGKQHSIEDVLDIAFGHVGINWRKGNYVRISEKYFRPADVTTLLGDATKAREKLGWVPEYTFEDLIKEMVESDLKR